MLKFAEWLLSLIQFRRLRPAYVPARRALILGIALIAAANTASAQVPDAMLSSMGLEVMWRGQAAMPLQDGRIVSTHLWSNPAEKRLFAELTLPPGVGTASLGANRTLRASADRLDATGKPIGIEAAKKEVEIRAARMLGRLAGIPAVEVSVPVIYLVIVTSDGVVQAFDAESGQPLWTATCDSVRFPTAPAGISDAGVAVAQGPYLYLFDLKTGKELSKREMQRASTAGVAMLDNIAFVSSLSGHLMAFEFGKPPATNPWTFRLYGRSVVQPAVSHRNHKLVAFPTEEGVVTIFSTEEPEKIQPWFNFEARAPLAGPVTFSANALYCGDHAGQLTKIGLDRVGQIEWRAMIGEPLGSQPMVVGKTVYLPNEIGDLMAVDDTTGVPMWERPTPRIRSILAATDEKIFCRTMADRLVVVDAKNGKLLGQTGASFVNTDVYNALDDRIYVITPSAQVLCLRHRGKEYVMPRFHETIPATPEQVKPQPGAAPVAPAAPAAQPATEDPFGAGMNAAGAFGAPPAAPGGDALDPFNTPAEPAAPAAPAGGGADPFDVPPAGSSGDDSNPFN